MNLDSDESCFTRSVGPEESQHLPRMELEGNSIQRCHLVTTSDFILFGSIHDRKSRILDVPFRG